MPIVQFSIGHKEYELSCKPGEEALLRRAASLLNDEATTILEQTGRMPEQRLLLLAGLMLADRTSAIEDRAASAERELQRLKNNPVKVPVIPEETLDSLAELAARAESLAGRLEDYEAD